MFFQFLSTIKVNLVAKIMQSACLWVIFHVKHKKLPFLIYHLFLILVNSKMPTIVGDVTGIQQSHHPLNIPHLVKKIKGFPLNVKEFQNTATYQKRQGGVPSTPPPPWICAYARETKHDLFVIKLHNKERATQSNLSTTFTLGSEESGRYGEVSV